MIRIESVAAMCIVFPLVLMAASADAQIGPSSQLDWPTTIQAVVDDQLSHMTWWDKLRVRNTEKENLIALYFDWGTGIRNRYGLWRGNNKLLLSACGRPCHPDDASMKIIEAVWQKLRQ